MTIRAIMLTNAGIATVSAILFNSLLAFLVLKYTSSKMKGYSRLILLHCICDVFGDFMQFSIGAVSYFNLFL
jgi:hypothetical protein